MIIILKPWSGLTPLWKKIGDSMGVSCQFCGSGWKQTTTILKDDTDWNSTQYEWLCGSTYIKFVNQPTEPTLYRSRKCMEIQIASFIGDF